MFSQRHRTSSSGVPEDDDLDEDLDDEDLDEDEDDEDGPGNEPFPFLTMTKSRPMPDWMKEKLRAAQKSAPHSPPPVRQKASMDRIVIVTKATRFEELVREHLTENAAAFALETRGQSLVPYAAEHDRYQRAVARITEQIPAEVMRTNVTRENLPSFLFRKTDLVIACGPDGHFANLAKYLDDQLVITVNPDRGTVAGALMLFEPEDVGPLLARIKEGTHKVEQLPFAKATIDDRKVVWAINDLFIGRRDHASARYEIGFGGRREAQSSSGIIVSTGTGGTGWLRSVQAMVESLGGSVHRLAAPPRTATELVFVVREPFPSPATGTSVVTGRVRPGQPLLITSHMPDGGFVFSDGVIERATEWQAGAKVTVTVGERYVGLVVA